MKRTVAFLLAVLLLLPFAVRAEEYAALPAFFQVKYQVKEQTINNGRSFVSKDVITTALPQVDQEINGLVDRYDQQLSGQMKGYKNPKRNSRLDIHVVHTVSGESCVSFLVLAREVYSRKQQQSPFTTRVYDMADGRLVTLQDLFADGSPAWDTLASAVRAQLSAYFPNEKADENTLDQLCQREALRTAPFLLGPVCLTLHYEAKTLYPKHPSLMKVRIPYANLRQDMTDYGKRQTDNSRYKMAALTFDDGPAYENSAKIINYLRQHGAQGTFFVVGERIKEYLDIVMRENDEQHSVQSHHYKHTNSEKSTVGRTQKYTQDFYKALTGAIGTTPLMLRPPYGKYEMFIKAKVDLPLILWDVDTKDWAGRSASRVLSVVREETKPGSIILLHDIKDKTPESARVVMDWLKENNYLCVTVEDLFQHFGQPMTPNRVYNSVKPVSQN